MTSFDGKSDRFSDISIHTFRVEGDTVTIPDGYAKLKFQSTPSVWKVTTRTAESWQMITISIHTFRVEGDIPR